ncbi:Gfo/Idh/MocA family oxidoreductase [Alicyclobacillus fastidiosus]|uniref:Gfo/Idh/MocA family oxidoreductase n=1 Tax=Alicyclobacillus fastidiosus TaxID=392011 RepID=A0ABY6ZHZ6_9BACL|nr:Gfo/Idh/MocA family oxidoreductase [Alicyclobacillus fastidiosus]WAH42529.1 Gfo/Idh/MocA family oxidoreductase [Alicyclobacillus fastidiosus]GMA64372.1 oxidoreductase [Alicyclobacillus fastidiosus]
MIKVGVIGAGAISTRHIEGYLSFPEDCKIAAIADIYLDKAQQHVSDYQLDAAAVADYKELLADPDLTLVSICTPPSTHAEIAIAFLKAGKHVLVEKPMAASLEECDAMIAAAQDSGCILSVVAQNRFRTPWMKLKSILDSKMAGEILHAQIDSYWWRGHSYYDLWWRGTWASEGGGCTLNHAVHHIDALQWMMGMPVEVSALMSNVSHDNAEVEDISIAALRFENGSVGQITSSVVHHGQEQQLVFQCQKAKLSTPWALYASSSRQNGFPERDSSTEEELQSFYDSLPEIPYQEHVGQIENVLSAIKDGVPVFIDGHDGRRTLELIVSIYKAASTGQRVTLPLCKDDPFYTKEGLMASVPHFYEKKASVERFENNTITTSGN